MITKITHISSVHRRYDTRIFSKECLSLASIPSYEVSLIIADDLGFEKTRGLTIHDVGQLNGRLNRIFKTTRRVLQKAIELDSDIYHLHDPELMGVGLKLKKLGKKVIYDIHEDVVSQIQYKPYIPRYAKPILSLIYGIFERYSVARFDQIITATEHILEKASKSNSNAICLSNYPHLEELNTLDAWKKKQNQICFVGLISKERNITNIVKALERGDVKLNLLGDFFPAEFRNEVIKEDGWQNVVEHGFASREEVKDAFSRSILGLIVNLPIEAAINSCPNKMFEYMSASLPIIASNFPRWKSIVLENDCGICVNPLSVDEIGRAIRELTNDPELARKMGENARKAVEKKYNWQVEEVKLYDIYNKLVK